MTICQKGDGLPSDASLVYRLTVLNFMEFFMQNDRPDNSLQPGREERAAGIMVDRTSNREQVPLSATDRMVRLFSGPKSAFYGLFRAPDKPATIGLSLIAAIILMSLSTMLVFDTTPVREEQRMQRERVEKAIAENRSMSKEERSNALEMSRRFESTPSPVMAFFGTLFFVSLLSLILAVVILIFAKILERGDETEVGFLSALSVSSLSMIPFAVVSVVLGGVQYLTDADIMSIGLPLLIAEEDLVLASLSKVLTISPLIFLAYLSIGTATLARRESMVGPMVVYTLLSLGLFAFFGFLSTITSGF